MSTVLKLLALLLVLAVTNAATFLYTTWRCREEMRGNQRLQGDIQERTEALQTQLEAAHAELDRLSVWGDFIRMQQDLNQVNAHINELNYGNALEAVDRVATTIASGGYGDLFRQHQARLLPLLEETKQGLRQRRDSARVHLVELNERAFGILSGIPRARDLTTEPEATPPAAGTTAPGRTVPPTGTQPAPSPDAAGPAEDDGSDDDDATVPPPRPPAAKAPAPTEPPR